MRARMVKVLRGASGVCLLVVVVTSCGGRTGADSSVDDSWTDAGAGAQAAGSGGSSLTTAGSDSATSAGRESAASGGSAECSRNRCRKPEDCCSGICYRYSPNELDGGCHSCGRFGESGCKPGDTAWCCSGYCSHDGKCTRAGGLLTNDCGSDDDCVSGFCWLAIGQCRDTSCDPRIYPEKVPGRDCQ